MTINKLWLDRSRYSLLEAAYLVCGQEPKTVKDKPPAIVVSAAREIRADLTEQGELVSAPHLKSNEIFLVPEYVRKCAAHFGSDFIFQGDKSFDNKLPNKNPHISNEFQIALDVFAAIFDQTQINPKYRGLTYKQAIEAWLAENRPSIKANSSEYNRIVMILNPDKHGNKIDKRYFDN